MQATVIDADGHVEPALVVDWRQRIAGEQGEEVDRTAKRWFDLTGYGSSTRRGAWDPAARLEDMDSEGIDVAVLFGSSRGVDALTGGDDDLGPTVARAFNDWLHDYCAHEPARLKAAAWVAPVDVAQACEEAERAVSTLGAVGVVMPAVTRFRSADDPVLDPLYETCQRLDVPVLFHGIGDCAGFPTGHYRLHFRRHAVAFPLSLMMASMELVVGGVLERFPTLRVGLFEGGVGWVPWWMDRLDEHVELQPFAAPLISERPTDLVARYVGEQRLFWSCEPSEAELGHVLDVVGDGAVVYASDYPHIDCEFPDSVAAIRRRELATDRTDQLLAANARALYGAGLDA